MKTPEIIIQQRKDDKVCILYKIRYKDGIGISQKKWLPKNKELFEKYNIQVNFEELGWLDTHQDEKEKTKEVKDKSLKESLYAVKHWFKVQKKKAKKKKQEHLSKK